MRRVVFVSGVTCLRRGHPRLVGGQLVGDGSITTPGTTTVPQLDVPLPRAYGQHVSV